MQMYMQRIKDDGSNLYSQTLIIPRIPFFEKLALSQFQLFIEAQKMSQFFVCLDCKNTILVRLTEGKEKLYIYFTHVKDIYWFKEVEQDKCI